MNFEHDNPSQQDDLLNIAAMIDVVFILLAFFVLSAQFTGVERDVGVGQRDAAVGSGASAADLPSVIPVRLSAGASGTVRIVIGQRVLADDDFAGITAQLTQINLPDTPVVIAPQSGLTVEQVARAIDAVLASPMNSIAVAKVGPP